MDSSSRRVLAALVAVGLWSTNAWAADAALARMSLGWLLLVQFGTAASVLLLARTAASRRRRTSPRDPPSAPAATRTPEARTRGCRCGPSGSVGWG